MNRVSYGPCLLLRLGMLMCSLTAIPTLSAAADAPATLRDPMQPPAALRASAVPAGEPAAPAALPSPRHLLVVDGRRYVVEGGRRRAVGDLLGDTRIERIEDAAVLVRSASGTQRLPLFGGVVKRAAVDTPQAALAAAPPDRPSSRSEKP